MELDNVIKKDSKDFLKCDKILMNTETVNAVNKNPLPNTTEYWRNISDYLPTVQKYYYISTHGRVYSTAYNKLLSQTTGDVPSVTIRCWNDTKVYAGVSRLVLMAFKPIREPQNHRVIYLNGNKRDNFIWNLEWADI